MNELHWQSLADVGELLHAGEVSSVELTRLTLARIEATDPVVHAYVGVMAESALREASAADADFAAGTIKSPLQGIPVGVKDLLHTAGFPTSAGSRVLEGFVPTRDAVVVEKLRAAGAVIVGKTVTHEFAYGQDKPATRNAWDTTCYPGGSSAGSGVSVAVGSAYGAIGTDTGASVRVPAALNGIVGLKPTYGRVSTRGVFPMSATLDSVGPMARTVRDVAIMLGVMAGPGGPDAAGYSDHGAIDEPVGDYLGGLGDDLTGVRIGVERDYFFYPAVTDDVCARVNAAIDQLAERGATIVEIAIQDLELAVPAGMAVLVGDTSEWHQKFLRERGDRYVPAVRTMLELGELVLATAYIKAQKTRTVVQRGYRAAFEEHGLTALVAPTVPRTTMRMDELEVDLTGSGETATSGFLHHNFLANVIGVPALSVPVGFDTAGKPVGMQLYGRPFAEADLFRIGAAYQCVTSWHEMHPVLPTA
ncbi:MAG: glutamyl-tRNA(Gln) amidotransferase subunit [Nocardia sp.]|uniref:amidase n=1 Tax=Nocardia sp. TaxID=1821 RepID=UPI002629FDB7|nr:amidase [Nocardia sp.]MCU1648029.1 glutamyl-tRNA(Gln) amidotransferase subunit [Nocardia sp.]